MLHGRKEPVSGIVVQSGSVDVKCIYLTQSTEPNIAASSQWKLTLQKKPE